MHSAHTKPLRVGIIGLGRAASTLEDDPLRSKPCTHAGAYAAHQATEIVAGADIDADARQAFAQRWSVPSASIYEDYRQMLAKEKLDVVSIVAYATDRAQMLHDALSSGVRGIWCEKAIATSLSEASEMVAACRKKNAVAIVNHSRRWNVLYQEAQRRIGDGELGQIQGVIAQFSGNLIHTGTHAFDVMRMLAGEVYEVSGWLEPRSGSAEKVSGYEPGQDEALGDIGGHATLRFDSGAIGTIHACSKKYFTFAFEVLGSQGALRIGNDMAPQIFAPGPSELCSGFDVLHPEALTTDIQKPLAPQVEELVGALANGNQPRSSLEDGQKALEIALAIHASHAAGGRPVALPLAHSHIRVSSR